jgi:ATP-binding cassette subfamily C protein CydCD
VVLGAGAWVAGVALTGAAAWLLVRAASLPPVLTLSVAVVTVRTSAVARPLLRYAERLVSHRVAFDRLGSWRAQVYADLVPRVPGALTQRRGELLTRVVEDVDAQVDGLLRGRLPAVSAGLALVLAVGAAVAVRPQAGLVLVAGLLVSALLAPALAGRRARWQDERTAAARAELADALVETVDGMEELATRAAGTALRVPVERSAAVARLEAHAARSAGAAAGLAQLGLGLTVAGIAVVASAAVRSGPLSPEFAAVLLLGAVTLLEPVLALPEAAVARVRAAGASARLAAIAARPVTVAARQGPEPELTSSSIGIRNLTAGWDGEREPALCGLDLDLAPGARIAVLGPSGSGKSTLAAVLVRLLDPRDGSIELGGIDVRTLPAEAVRARIALVGDGVDHVFASTVRENLRLARPRASDDELRAVLAQVRLGRWLDELPDGLDTWLGEGGATISGGERRRLVTARALLADPDVLVLDEPTEGLDEPTAQALMSDLLAASSGRSVLLLTHRTEGLELVDAVHELHAGRFLISV